jgi:hypothetical protein
MSSPAGFPGLQAQLQKIPPLMLIDGLWVPAISRKTFEVVDPATGEAIGVGAREWLGGSRGLSANKVRICPAVRAGAQILCWVGRTDRG